MSRPEPAAPRGYLYWSRDPAVGLFAVLPLWLGYEVLRLGLAPDERNGAEALISEVLRVFGPIGLAILRGVFALVVVAAMISLVRRDLPWGRLAVVIALEGLVWALVLGPLAAALEQSSTRLLALPPPVGRAAAGGLVGGQVVRDLVGSLGAGIFEELLFRLVLLSVAGLLLMRASSSFGLPRVVGLVLALLLSAVVFSLFHHVGPGAAPFSQRVFVFRAMAGLVLGTLFVTRGFGVCVWTHALYDVYFYLTA